MDYLSQRQGGKASCRRNPVYVRRFPAVLFVLEDNLAPTRGRPRH